MNSDTIEIDRLYRILSANKVRGRFSPPWNLHPSLPDSGGPGVYFLFEAGELRADGRIESGARRNHRQKPAMSD